MRRISECQKTEFEGVFRWSSDMSLTRVASGNGGTEQW